MATKNATAKKPQTNGKTTKTVKNEVVRKKAEQTTAKQLSEYDKRMAQIVKENNAKLELEAKERAEKKALEIANKKKPGVIARILSVIAEAKTPVTQSQILEVLKSEFPKREEKSMLNTIKAQIGGKKRPLRMEREKRVILGVSENKAGVKSYVLEMGPQPAPTPKKVK